MERESQSAKLDIGSILPEFNLPSVDGTTKGTKYLKEGKASLIAFTCNHCPYVKGSEEMLIEIARKFEKDGLRTVAISSNDAIQYPEDGFEPMKKKSRELNLPYPYV